MTPIIQAALGILIIGTALVIVFALLSITMELIDRMG